MRLKRIVTVVVWVGLASTAQAELKVASLFSDHVVLQQGVPLDVWGAGDVGKTVELSFSGQIVSAPVVEPGRWRIRLKPLAAHAQGEDLHLSDGQTQLVVHDVVVGEVWLAAGQSNMQMRVQEMTKKLPETLAMVKEADMPGIRFLRINEPVAGGRREDRSGVTADARQDQPGPARWGRSLPRAFQSVHGDALSLAYDRA